MPNVSTGNWTMAVESRDKYKRNTYRTRFGKWRALIVNVPLGYKIYDISGGSSTFSNG